jgi:DNA-binding NarL/FixJ family response regulator
MVASSPSKSAKIGVLIVDDHPAIREAVSYTIAGKLDMEVVGEVGSAAAALRFIEKHHPDVAIVDISLDDTHGLDLVQNIRSQFPKVKIIVFSMYDEQVYAERAVRAGASSYLMKKEPTQNICEAIRSVYQGDIYLSHRMFSRIVGRAASNRSRGPGFDVDELTDREMAVFQMLGEGHSIETIADTLNLSRKTAEAYRRRAKEKLGLETIGELIQYAVQWVHSQSDSRERK